MLPQEKVMKLTPWIRMLLWCFMAASMAGCSMIRVSEPALAASGAQPPADVKGTWLVFDSEGSPSVELNIKEHHSHPGKVSFTVTGHEDEPEEYTAFLFRGRLLCYRKVGNSDFQCLAFYRKGNVCFFREIEQPWTGVYPPPKSIRNDLLGPA